jgi:hypothetical protein
MDIHGKRRALGRRRFAARARRDLSYVPYDHDP